MLSRFSFFSSVFFITVLCRFFFSDVSASEDMKKNTINVGFIKYKGSKKIQDAILLGLQASFSEKAKKLKNNSDSVDIILKTYEENKKGKGGFLCGFVHSNNLKFLISGYDPNFLNEAISEASNAEIPVIGGVSGDVKLYKLEGNVFFNYRASFEEEIKAILELLDHKAALKVAILFQDGLLDTEMKSFLENEFKAFSSFQHFEFVFKKDLKGIEDALKSVDESYANVVILLGESQNIGSIVKKIKTNKKRKSIKNAQLFLLSSTFAEFFSSDLKKLSAEEKKGIYYSQIVPTPNSLNIPLIKDYQEDVKDFCDANKSDIFKQICTSSNRISFASLEAYIIGKIMLEAIKKKREVSRDAIKKSIKELNVDLGGVKIKFSDYENRKKVKASSRVYITEFDGENFVPYQKKS